MIGRLALQKKKRMRLRNIVLSTGSIDRPYRPYEHGCPTHDVVIHRLDVAPLKLVLSEPRQLLEDVQEAVARDGGRVGGGVFVGVDMPLLLLSFADFAQHITVTRRKPEFVCLCT